MKDIIKKIIEHAGVKALSSAQAFEKAASELGYSKEEIAEMMKDFNGSPLDDDDLDAVVGGTDLPLNISFN
ncbi:MAG: hypothetical protein ABFC94_18565 [Syntrophomonas sp.]